MGARRTMAVVVVAVLAVLGVGVEPATAQASSPVAVERFESEVATTTRWDDGTALVEYRWLPNDGFNLWVPWGVDVRTYEDGSALITGPVELLRFVELVNVGVGAYSQHIGLEHGQAVRIVVPDGH